MDFREITEFIKDTFKYFLVIIAVFIIFVYVISIQQVVGPSMENTLTQDDVVVISKLSYKIHSIERFDIVVFQYDGMKNLIKRVIGIPGDIIEFKYNNLYVNGNIYREAYLKDDSVIDDFSSETLGYKVIPKGKYLVLGDNRNNSLDSRDIGFIDSKDVIGKVVSRVWPINEFKIVK